MRDVPKFALAAVGFFIRHLLASLVSVAAPVALVGGIYLVLLVIGIVTNQSLGSPIALPLWILVAAVSSTFSTALYLFPAVWVAEITSRNFGRWRVAAQIPISMIALFVLVQINGWLLKLALDGPMRDTLTSGDGPLIIYLLLLIPLGIYWITARLVEFALSVLGRLSRSLWGTVRGRAPTRLTVLPS
jgi:hypothetical protein